MKIEGKKAVGVVVGGETVRQHQVVVGEHEQPFALRPAGQPVHHGGTPVTVQVELGDEVELDGETMFGVWSHGQFFPLGPIET